MKRDVLDELQFYEKSISKIARKAKSKVNISALEKGIIFESCEDDCSWEITITNIRVLQSAYNTEPLYVRNVLEKQLATLRRSLTCPFDFPCIVVYSVYTRRKIGVRPIQYWDTIDMIERRFWSKKDLIKGVYVKKVGGLIGEKDAVKIKIYNLKKETI
jgi:hypothetical protein